MTPETMMRAYAEMTTEDRAKFRAMLIGYDLADNPPARAVQQRRKKGTAEDAAEERKAAAEA